MSDPTLSEQEELAQYRRAREARTAAGLVVLTQDDILNMPQREFLLKGVMAKGEMSVWYGPPKSGKSFLLMHAGYGILQDRDVFGMSVTCTRVLQLACEGRSGLRGRMEALKAEYGESKDFLVIAQPVDLCSETSTTDTLIAILLEQRVGLLIVDTLNRVMGGGEENSSADMGAVIANLDRIRAGTRAHIAVIHHATKNRDGGPRGHGSLAGAADAIIEVSNEGGIRMARLTDSKDDATGTSMQFELRMIGLCNDSDGDPRTTCLVGEIHDAPAPRHRQAKKLGKNEILALQALHDVVIIRGHSLPTGSGFPTTLLLGVQTEEWRAAVYDKLGGLEPNSQRSAFNRALIGLVACNRMGSHAGWVWPC